MPPFPFRLAPLFACLAVLFAPLAQAEEQPADSPARSPADMAPAKSLPVPVVATPSPSIPPAATVAEALAPDTVAPASTNADQADLWARVRSGFKMPERDSADVKRLERFYASKPQYIQRVAERGRRYLYFIVNEVEKRGMPTEIALLPIVESAFSPKAQSWATASGLWQFMPATGARYGLERTWWYDGRQDVMAATYAALDYLQDLYNQFGDWQLALAAYNWGEGGVGRAVAKTRAQGIDATFDSIKKPNETSGYVPALMAVRNIIANPKAFGLTLPDMPNKPYFEPVSTGRHIDVELAAKLADTTVEELLMLNPGLIRPVFAYKDDRKLLLPAEKVGTFEQNLQRYDKPLLSWQPYVTKKGESIDAIASKFSIAQNELRQVNKLGSGRTASGQTILVPMRDNVEASDRQNLAALIAGAAASAARSEESAPAKSARSAEHKVAKGESLFSIARKYAMKPEELKRLNGLSSNKVAVGAVLKVDGADAKPSKLAKAKPAKELRYVVKRGDTLDEIARKYDVSVAELKKWNKPVAGRGALKVGYKLAIRGEG
ncbi:LysM peptidoglycan-binding domain-containing protein [Chitinimonas sp.]|uniref:LysM peptidoglycan-binding domain-containing protein n=1 Tax=Chitinimonas sp. TaxID=1934313 RepID=UPI0035AF9C35